MLYEFQILISEINYNFVNGVLNKVKYKRNYKIFACKLQAQGIVKYLHCNLHKLKDCKQSLLEPTTKL